MAHPLPIPADFAANAHRLNAELIAIYGVVPTTLAKWRRAVGKPANRSRPSRIRPIPEGFAEMVQTTHDRALAKHFHAATVTVRKWRQELGVAPFKPTPPPHRGAANSGSFRNVPIPADFAEVASRMGIDAMIRHYGRSRKLIKRWIAEAGVTPASGRTVAKAKVRRGAHRQPGISMTFANAPKDGSLAGRAAEFLRRRDAVYRCTERGGADPKGAFWRVGLAVLTDDELVGRAERRGFRPDAWKELAA